LRIVSPFAVATARCERSAWLSISNPSGALRQKTPHRIARDC
jgi:hypothetical protein